MYISEQEFNQPFPACWHSHRWLCEY